MNGLGTVMARTITVSMPTALACARGVAWARGRRQQAADVAAEPTMTQPATLTTNRSVQPDPHPVGSTEEWAGHRAGTSSGSRPAATPPASPPTPLAGHRR